MVKMLWFARAAIAAVAVTGASGAAFAQADQDAFARLPSQEIRGVQIGWVPDSYAAFTEAIYKTRPLIVVFGSPDSPLTLAFARYVAPCPHLGQLAGAAIFTYGGPDSDEMARRMALHLRLTDYPTISVIAPRTDQLVELYRMEGIFDAASIQSDLYLALVRNDLWPADMPAPAPLPSHYLAYPNLACTPEGLRRLGLSDQ